VCVCVCVCVHSFPPRSFPRVSPHPVSPPPESASQSPSCPFIPLVHLSPTVSPALGGTERGPCSKSSSSATCIDRKCVYTFYSKKTHPSLTMRTHPIVTKHIQVLLHVYTFYSKQTHSGLTVCVHILQYEDTFKSDYRLCSHLALPGLAA